MIISASGIKLRDYDWAPVDEKEVSFHWALVDEKEVSFHESLISFKVFYYMPKP